MERSGTETLPYSAHLVRASLADDDLWDLVVATVTEPVMLNRSTRVDIAWLVAVVGDWRSGDPMTDPTSGRLARLVLVADEETAIDDTVAMVTENDPPRRVPVDEASWATFLQLIDDDRLDHR
jgi:hypothetical protein